MSECNAGIPNENKVEPQGIVKPSGATLELPEWAKAPNSYNPDGSLRVALGATGDPTAATPLIVSTEGKFQIASFVRPSNTDGYTAGDNVSTNTTAGSAFVWTGILPKDGGAAIIVDAILSIDLTSVTSGMAGFTLFLFTVAKTRDDNAAASLSYTDMDTYLGRIEFPTPTDRGAVIVSSAMGVNLEINGAAAADDIYSILVTNGTYTPASGTGFKCALKTVNV